MTNYFTTTEIKEINTKNIKEFFLKYLEEIHYQGSFGIACFRSVSDHLIPEQQQKLKILLQEQFNEYNQSGSIIILGIAYKSEIIDCINQIQNGLIDKVSWNQYGAEYTHLNLLLKTIGSLISSKFGGILIPPTTGTPDSEIHHVTDYFPKTISHRIVAEYAGIGWRGKNGLLVTEQFGPALRFTSILTTLPLNQGIKLENQCGNCKACLDVCSILNNKANLSDYRENCRKYMLTLGLEQNICGKCIKACVNSRRL